MDFLVDSPPSTYAYLFCPCNVDLVGRFDLEQSLFCHYIWEPGNSCLRLQIHDETRRDETLRRVHSCCLYLHLRPSFLLPAGWLLEQNPPSVLLPWSHNASNKTRRQGRQSPVANLATVLTLFYCLSCRLCHTVTWRHQESDHSGLVQYVSLRCSSCRQVFLYRSQLAI